VGGYQRIAMTYGRPDEPRLNELFRFLFNWLFS